MAEKITDGLIEAKPDLVGLRPVLIGLCRSVVSSPPFRAAARRSARTLHHAIMDGSARNIVLTVQDIGALLESALATHPGLMEKLPPQVTAAIGRLESLPAGERMVWIVRIANRVRAATIGLLLLGMGLCTASVSLSSEKRRAMVWLGIALAAFGLVLGIVARFGGLALGFFVQPTEMGQVLAGLGSAFLGGLAAWAVGVGFTGLVLASASASLLERVPLGNWADGAWRWLTGRQEQMRARLARGSLGAAIGAALLFWPLPSLTVAGWLVGLVVAFVGLREAFVAALHLLPQSRAGPGRSELRFAACQAAPSRCWP